MKELKQLKNGKVVELKKDGSPSKRHISDYQKMRFLGFKFPEVTKRFDYLAIKILKGNPKKDDEIIFTLRCGTSMHNNFFYGHWLSAKNSITKIKSKNRFYLSSEELKTISL